VSVLCTQYHGGMRFRSLRVANLKAVRLFEVDDLKDFIMIAGPNGCGKSCIFDAIRLLKSSYGGYSTDEHMQWFSEFAINPQDSRAFRQVFRDPTMPVEISATIEYAESERTFLHESAADLIWPIAWARVTGQRMDYWTFSRMAIATQLGHFRPAVEQQVATLQAELAAAMQSSIHRIAIQLRPDGNIQLADCLPAEVSFQAYAPNDLGVIEYHSASRAYPRQPLQGINLDSRSFDDQRRTHSLYNWQNKYQNVKTELAAGYLRTLIAEKAGEAPQGEDLNETLKELFRTFFPDKEYAGVRALPGGSLDFPVVLPGGESHDIDELSSGEKEILYGYLRLRNSTPRHSVILLDEPELHLNPSLLQGFADFYYRHLGVAQGNQLWLVTHSDTLLRQAVGNSNYRVYHMVGASTTEGNQASEVVLDDDVERVVVDLVGDLAAYRPHAKVVILEGGDRDAFDQAFVRRLFPDFARRVNLVSGGPKRRVRDLYAALDQAATDSGIRNRFFAIVDRDAEAYTPPEPGATEFMWPVYHIENFLLQPAAIRDACRSLTGTDPFGSDAEAVAALQTEAVALIPSLVLERVRSEIDRRLVAEIRIEGDPAGTDVARDLIPSVEGSLERVIAAGAALTVDGLATRVDAVRGEFTRAVETDAWLREFPGRRILRRFVSAHAAGVPYEAFRNVIVDKLAAEDTRPQGMSDVLEAIEAA
jgi:energy-coupling factor transporter ATP-binding protein EcfA2